MNRTHNNGELRLENVGQTVELKGRKNFELLNSFS